MPSIRSCCLYASSFLLILLSFGGQGQVITTIAGVGIHGYSGDGGPGTAARLFEPHGVCVDRSGNLYIADYFNHVVRKLDTAGIITTIAGNGIGWFDGDGGPATAAELFYPSYVCFDADENLLISDYGNHRIRKIDRYGIISTVAGNGTYGYSGDGGPATAAQIFDAAGTCTDASGNLYICDIWNNVIRKVDTAGIISTFAGTGLAGYNGDGGTATNAQLNNPGGVCVDTAGNLYIGDQQNHRFRKVNTLGIISTFAGTGTPGYNGDGGQATAATLNVAGIIHIDKLGNFYILDYQNFVIRKITPSGIITTVAGNGTYGYNGDNIAATAAQINYATDVCLDSAGNLYIADHNNERIRKVSMHVTGINDIVSHIGALNVYPNPNDGNFSVELPPAMNGQCHITICNAAGRQAKEMYTLLPEVKVKLSVPPGLYIITATTNDRSYKAKFIVTK